MTNPIYKTALIGLLTTAIATPALGGSRQLGTGGATSISGAAGGGIVPWASIAGYGAAEETGYTGFFTFLDLDDYDFQAAGVAIGFRNRFEVSLARQRLDLDTLGPAIGMPGATLEQDIVGLKYRIAGDLIYSDLPQIAVGLQYKKLDDFTIPSLVGAKDDSGFDFYVSATKVFLAGAGGLNGFANATVRATKANQVGLLGFGGDRGSSHELQFEGSGGVFFNRYTALGVEYRTKPNNLGFAEEDDWMDVFFAWFPNRHVSVVLAYADLGDVATLPDQRGLYLSIEGSF